MDLKSAQDLTYLVVGLLILAVVILVSYLQTRKGNGTHDGRNEESTDSKQHSVSSAAGKKKKKQRIDSDKGSKDTQVFQHKWLMTTLKGHSGLVSSLNYSVDNNYLASVANDRAMFLWLTKDFKTSNHKQYRVNIEFDYPSKVCFSPDNRAVLVSKNEKLSMEVFKIDKKTDGSGITLHSALEVQTNHKTTIVGMGIACNGKFMMSCSSDGLLAIWNLKGALLADTKVCDGGLTTLAKISPCGRYVGACGKYSSGSDLIVFAFNNNTNVLSQHLAIPTQKIGIYSFDFNTDSSKIGVIGMDFSWRLYDITGSRVTLDCSGTVDKVVIQEFAYPVIKISGDGRLIIIGCNSTLYFFSCRMAGLSLGRIDGIHGDEPIRDIVFSEGDKYFVTCGDKQIRVFHNVPGMQEAKRHILHLIEEKSTSPAFRNRLKMELSEIEETLSKF